ncbi:DUF695 domain-containing protein [Mucilaginibacter flavus]|uniref:DUF695 domain-containing protein n=1 Tax=Mucilaginibacter flavus TaxID=931504 RepID=UPI0025B33AED|nr:DUF695 domain-containing protein [Mucilaginibacter flavus]MDN3583008.1 DUF695 domain-containing protein [Mucilaginibacter flavus]
MGLLNTLFKRKEEPIKSYADFWNWFQKNEQDFFKVVKAQGNIEELFFNKLSPKLNELKDGYFYLTGMLSPDTAELVFTADGAIKNIPFIEEFVAAAPQINSWKFTALKPALDITDVGIKMAGYQFNAENIHFYANDTVGAPDEIDITLIHDDLDEQNEAAITNGIYIFLDNYLGELNFATAIDHIRIVIKSDAEKELVPIVKLKDFLIWREKEFIEKYEDVRHNTDEDEYASLTADLKSGNKLIAIVNTALLNWDSKASHPWILTVEIKYNGEKNNGMPDNATYQLLDEIEDKMREELKDHDGYLNIGRQTADSVREIYFACNDFRKPSKVLFNVKRQYADRLKIDYDIYKDKYWQSFDRFIPR